VANKYPLLIHDVGEYKYAVVYDPSDLWRYCSPTLLMRGIAVDELDDHSMNAHEANKLIEECAVQIPEEEDATVNTLEDAARWAANNGWNYHDLND
jgi:hypothetical protein